MMTLPLCVHVIHASMLFAQYLWYALMNFRQTFVTSASWGKDELVRFWGQKIKGQGHSITASARSTNFCDISSMHWRIFSRFFVASSPWD